MTEKKEERGGGEGVVAPHTHVCTHVAHLPKEGEGEQRTSPRPLVLFINLSRLFGLMGEIFFS